MPRKKHRILSGSLLLFLMLFALVPGMLSAEPVWTSLETRHTVIQYTAIESLEAFQKSIRFGKGWWASGSEYMNFTETQNRTIAAAKVDAVFERAQEILDMRKKTPKVTLKIYPDKQTLERAFRQIYKKECPFRAWYEYRSHSISLNALDCSEGILAHELAHSIIDTFLTVRPPGNTAEILARYVDSHLK